MYLQKDIENYKFGIKPIKTNRCDEIGWLKNNFVELTEKLDEEKKNQNRIIASISHDIKMNNIDKNHKLLRKRFIKTFLKIKNLKKVSTFESF